MDKVAGPLKTLAKLWGVGTKATGKGAIAAGNVIAKGGKKLVETSQKGVPGLTNPTRVTKVPGGIVHNPTFRNKWKGFIPKVVNRVDKTMGKGLRLGLPFLAGAAVYKTMAEQKKLKD